MFDNLSEAELKAALSNIKALPSEEQEAIGRLVEEAIHQRTLQNCRDNFIDFIKYVWPGFICGPHHLTMANQFQRMADGKASRVTISLPPRSGKSMLTSVYFPAWFLGKFPDKKLMQASHKAELATGFGRQVRELFSDPKFQEVFPGVTLKADNKAAGRWGTNKGGSYLAMGVGGSLTGFGADLCLAPDSVIITESGEMTISDVFNDKSIKKVLSFDPDTGKPIMANILARGGRWSDEMVDVVIDGVKTSCTPNHPFFVKDRGWVEAKDLKPGDVTCRVRLRGSS